MSTKPTSLAGLLGAVALLGITAPAETAAGAVDTVATFALQGGSMNVSIPATASLGTADTGTATVSGSLGATQVADARGLSVGWQASAATTGFTSDSGTKSIGVTYSSGAVTKVGTVTALSLGTVPLTTVAAPVVSGTPALGNNSASWNPVIAVALPSDSLAGKYSGTITTSVA